jgi:hypothetical protein
VAQVLGAPARVARPLPMDPKINWEEARAKAPICLVEGIMEGISESSVGNADFRLDVAVE